jgi:hypothetical protein
MAEDATFAQNVFFLAGNKKIAAVGRQFEGSKQCTIFIQI